MMTITATPAFFLAISLSIFSTVSAHAQAPEPTLASQDYATRLQLIAGYVSADLAKFEANLQSPKPEPTSRDISAAALVYAMRDQDFAKAQALLEHLFTLQAMDPASKSYGSVLWQENHPEISDANAIEFTSMALGPLFLRYSGKFTPEFQAAAKPHLQAAVVAMLRHNVPVAYTNIFFMRFENLILLGEYLHDPSAVAQGVAFMDQWIQFTRENGISEFDSSVYSGVQTNVVHDLYSNVQDPAIKAKVKVILDYLWTDFSANFFAPRQEICGPSSRTYSFVSHDYNVNGHLYLGGLETKPPLAVQILSEDGMTWANGTWDKYRPAAKILALGSVPVRIVEQRWGSLPGMDRYNYITPDFSIGSASRFYGEQDRLVAIHLATAKPMPVITVVPDAFDSPYGNVVKLEKGGHRKIRHLKYLISAVQEKGSLLALYDLAPGLKGQPQSSISTSVLLPLDADELCVNGQPVTWNDLGISVPAGATVGVRVGQTAVAVRIFHADAMKTDGAVSFWLKADGKKLHAGRLVAYHSDGSDSFTSVTTLRSGVLLLTATCADSKAFQSFLARAAQWTFLESSKNGMWQVNATPPAKSGRPVLTASLGPDGTGPRSVDGKETTPVLLSVNGMDWASEIWKELEARK
jgi:hypothetical protein